MKCWPVRVSDSGLSFQKQDVGDPGKSSYTSIRINHNPILEIIMIQDVILTDSEAATDTISPRLTPIYQSIEVLHMVLLTGSFKFIKVNNAHQHTGVESRDFYCQVGVDYNQSNFADSVSTSLPQDTCYNGCIAESGGNLYGFPATRHPAYQTASQFPYGSHGIHYLRPSLHFGNFPTDMQHTGKFPAPPPGP